MNIIVINTPNKPFTNPSIIAESLDALTIATIIKEKQKNTTFIDMDALQMDNNINAYLKSDNIILFVFDYQIPLHRTEAKENIREIINNLNKKSKLLIIGKTSAYFYKEFIDMGFDVIFIKTEDYVNEVIDNINNISYLKNIPNLILKDNNDIFITEKENKIKPYNEFPYPDRSLIDMKYYNNTRTIITSRGCTGACTFCQTPTFFGKWTCKTPDQIIEEIKYLIEKYNTKKILFLDDNMIIDKFRMYELCDKIKENNFNVLFGCLGSINYYDEKLFKYMYEVGFRWIHFGIESGSERILKLMHKELDLSKVKEIIKQTKEIGFRVRASFILDYIGSTKEDVDKTIELIKETEPTEIRLHYLTLRVGTKLYNENKNIQTTQYIHSNKPNINSNLESKINELTNVLKEKGYIIIFNEQDLTKYENYKKDTKFASFVPLKYGMCWYE